MLVIKTSIIFIGFLMNISHNIIQSLLNLPVSLANLNRFIKHHYPLIHKQIIRQTSFLSQYSHEENLSDISILERFYCIENNLTDRPLCKVCHKNHVTSFNKQTKTYRKWCSPSCQASDKDCITSSKQTRLKRYGDANYNGAEQSRATRMNNNNGSWHATDFPDKVKRTKKKHFGSENYTNYDKTRQTIEMYKSENKNYYKDIAERRKATSLHQYGDENWNNRPKFLKTLSEFPEAKKQSIIEKRSATNQARYGCDSLL
jgi:uncharacterized protein